MSPAPTLARMVIYTLNEGDVSMINETMPVSVPHADRPGARQVRNPVKAGDQFPAMVVAAWSGTCVNLRVFLDGEPTYWATSRVEGDQPGNWAWPTRA